jgi:hypothetical protein
MLLKMQPLHRRSAANMALWSAYNREFHARLFAASGRRHLCRVICVLRDSIESYIRVTVAETGLEDAWAMHREIFESFSDGDAVHVAQLCRRHVRHSAHALMEGLKAGRESNNATAVARTSGARAPLPDHGGRLVNKANAASDALTEHRLYNWIQIRLT